tara:strand:- start:1273 stop:2961 length:1689 start_codon:yes stop_codon:yes gene_type:complete
MAKVYKNMSTLFERVKLGKIDNQSSVVTKTFSNISYFKKKELVQPHLHYLDVRALDASISSFVHENSFKNTPLFKKTQDKINAKRASKKLENYDVTKLHSEMIKIYDDFPKEVSRDVFNQYYCENGKLQFENRSENNKYRYRMIDRANDPVTKVITRESHIKSMVFSRNMVQYYLSMFAIMKEEDPQEYQEMMNKIQQESSQSNQDGNDGGDSKSDSKQQKSDGDDSKGNDSKDDKGEPNGNKPGEQSGSGKGDGEQQQDSPQSALDKLMEKFLNNPDNAAQKLYQEAMDTAKETSSNLDETMSKEDMDDLWEELANNPNKSGTLDKLSDGYLKQMQQKLSEIDINGDKLKSHLKKILDKSFSYFNAKEEPIFDEFLNSPNIDGILDFEFLHPKFRKFSLEDIQVKDVRKSGKINVYVDVSGSMGSSANIKDTKMDRLTFAKAVLIKLKRMDIINEVYTFNTNVKKRNTELNDLLTIDTSGGTSLNRVVNHIAEQGVNAIVITDADDHLNTYSSNAFFLGVAGSNFRYFNPVCRKQYVENKQLIQFTGDHVYNIGLDGYPIM